MGLKKANQKATKILLKSQEAKDMKSPQRNQLDYLCKNAIFVLERNAMNPSSYMLQNAHAVIIGINKYQDQKIPNLTLRGKSRVHQLALADAGRSDVVDGDAKEERFFVY